MTRCQQTIKAQRLPNRWPSVPSIGSSALAVLTLQNCAMAEYGPLPTVLAKRGKLIADAKDSILKSRKPYYYPPALTNGPSRRFATWTTIR